MGDQQQRDMSGILFKNDRKTNDRAPDYRGTATIDGKPYRMSAWLKEGRNGGKKFMSFQFEADDGSRGNGGTRQQTSREDDGWG